MHPTEPIAAPIESLDWIVGRWAEPAGGTMVGMFRWLQAGAVRFYELLTVEPEGDGLVWRIKHFKSEASPHRPDDEFRYAQR